MSYEHFSALITFLLQYKIILKCFDCFNITYWLSQHSSVLDTITEVTHCTCTLNFNQCTMNKLALTRVNVMPIALIEGED